MNVFGRWIHHTVRLTLILSTFCALGSGNAYAGNRECTKEEREAADKWLFLNVRDRTKATERHLPFGIPVTNGIAANVELLVSWEFVIQYDL